MRKYVLAQFRSNAELGWIGELRTALGVSEVKYKHFLDRRPRLRKQQDLWERVERGVFAATLIVTDPLPVMNSVRSALISEGAVEGHDFDNNELSRRCATALIAGTPIAYLPEELIKVIEPRGLRLLDGLSEFTPDALQKELGPLLKHASIFAARAHAVFDCASADPMLGATTETFRSPLSRIILAELMSTRRIFDEEDALSATVLNRASQRIAESMAHSSRPWLVSDQPLVEEVDSRELDHLQAADMAAGWAREVLETSKPIALADRFDRVWINGRLLQRGSARMV